MKLAVSAPTYGWTDLVYSLIPTGHALRSTRTTCRRSTARTRASPFGIPKQSIVAILYGTGQFGATFAPTFRRITRRFRCLYATDPFETAPLCQNPIANIAARVPQRPLRLLPEPLVRADRVRSELPDPGLQRRARSPTRCSRRSRTCGCPTASRRRCPGYPIQQYFGDYQHFVQNKAKEWGDLCGADHHVCTLADYPGGDVNATPAGLYRTGVTTRLNRFVDHFARPPATRASRSRATT